MVNGSLPNGEWVKCRTLFGVENIGRGRQIESGHIFSIKGGCFDHTSTRTLAVNSIRQILETEPTTVEFISESPRAKFLCQVFLVGSEEFMDT